ncbi:MAG: DNA/RNA non-specific endonuclease [Thermoanaerobaculia bacterium]
MLRRRRPAPRGEPAPHRRRGLPARPRVAAALLVVLSLAGCALEVQRLRPAPFTAYQRPQAGFTAEEIAWIEDNCGPFGAPTLTPEWPHGPTAFVVREGYVLRHSSVDKIALWVCEHVEPGELQGDARRRDDFDPDPELEPGQRAELADYRGSGYDRGHEAPAGNQKASQRLNDETFFLSNMIPQEPGNNRQVWRELEKLTRDWVAEGVVPSAWIVTGGFFYDPDEEDEATADGLIPFQAIGDNQVSVPTHVYKVVLARRGPAPADPEAPPDPEHPTGPEHAGDAEDPDDPAGEPGAGSSEGEPPFRAVAFVLENRPYERPFRFEDHVRSVRWIEERTGLDFFPDLVDPLVAEELEARKGSLWSEEP